MNPGALLCEACGYPLQGIEPDLPCPECGRAWELSHPSHRAGSPWQRRSTPGAAIAGDWGVLRHPIRFWNQVRLDTPRAVSLLAFNVFLTSLLPTLTILVTMCSPVRHFNPEYLLVFFAGFAFVVTALSAVEFAGLPFFARQRGWRVPHDASVVIVAHASAGWLIGAVLISAVWATWTLLDFYAPTILSRRIPALSAVGVRSTLGDLLTPALALSFITGMVTFSLLCGAGMRAMRFANRG